MYTTGSFGKFSWMSLGTNLVSIVVFLKIANIIVDEISMLVIQSFADKKYADGARLCEFSGRICVYTCFDSLCRESRHVYLPATDSHHI